MHLAQLIVNDLGIDSVEDAGLSHPLTTLFSVLVSSKPATVPSLRFPLRIVVS